MKLFLSIRLARNLFHRPNPELKMGLSTTRSQLDQPRFGPFRPPLGRSFWALASALLLTAPLWLYAVGGEKGAQAREIVELDPAIARWGPSAGSAGRTQLPQAMGSQWLSLIFQPLEGPRHRIEVLPTTLGQDPATAPGVGELLDATTRELQQRLSSTGRVAIDTELSAPETTDPARATRGGKTELSFASGEMLTAAFPTQHPQFRLRAVLEGWPEPTISFRILSGDHGQVLYSHREALRWSVEGPHDLRQERLGIAVQKGIYRIAVWLARRPWQGRVLERQGDVVVLGSGRLEGLSPGLELEALSNREPVVDPESGLAVGQGWAAVGQVKVLEVGPHLAMAVVVDGCEGLTAEDRVELLSP